MPSASSVIRVSIIGDASKLVSATKDANKATGGLLGSAGKAVGGFLIASKGIELAFETIQGGLEKADKLSDSLDTIAGTVSPAFAKTIGDVAFSMTNIGLSADEVAALAANFGNLATAAGVSEPVLTTLTPKMVELAAAIGAQTGKTADEVITDIGKAAQGSQKVISEYGVLIDKSLNPDQQILSIFDQLMAKYPDVLTATSDFAGKQEALNAKWDNFSIKVGQALEGPLSGMLDFFITIIDRDIPNMMRGFGEAGDAITGFAKTVLGPLGNINDILGGIGDFFGQNHSADFRLNFSSNLSESATQAALDRNRSRNGQSTLGRDP